MDIKQLNEKLDKILNEDNSQDVDMLKEKIESIKKHVDKLIERINYRLLDNVSYTGETLNKIVDNVIDDLYEADEYLMQAYRTLG